METQNKNKLNGYAKWIIVAIAIGSIIWSFASINGKLNENNAVLNSEIKHITENTVKIEQRLENIEERLLIIERGKE